MTRQERSDDEIFNTPQKRYIRHEIWAKYAIKRKEKDDLDFIKYLTFPALGCYDVKILNDLELLETKEIEGITTYGSVGFCEKDPHKFALIQQKLPGARYCQGTYEDIVGACGEELPIRAQRWFPFDVINLDFTSPLFSSDRNKITNAIKRTFNIQKLKSKSFTLFLTLPALRSADTEDGKNRLDDILKNNLAKPNMEEFKRIFFEKYPFIDINNRIYEQLEYIEFLLISIPKMIVSMGTRENFDIICNERFSYIGDHYDGRKNGTYMVKFVFECEYIGSVDGFSLPHPVDYLAEKYPQRIIEFFNRNFIDINQFFESNGELKTKYCSLEY
ncbi:Uncharacterised protein [uncultured archaeon]|nr:Uncharacterised protein [uncultured archaeon]